MSLLHHPLQSALFLPLAGLIHSRHPSCLRNLGPTHLHAPPSSKKFLLLCSPQSLLVTGPPLSRRCNEQNAIPCEIGPMFQSQQGQRDYASKFNQIRSILRLGGEGVTNLLATAENRGEESTGVLKIYCEEINVFNHVKMLNFHT